MNSGTKFKFRLYVAGDAQNSVLAIAHLTAFCREYLAGRHEIEIVDVLREPRRALVDGIFLTPTLVKLSPSPSRRIVGTLSQVEPVINACGLAEIAV